MTVSRLTQVLAAGSLAAVLTTGLGTTAQALPGPVTTASSIAGAAPTDQVRWRGGYGWRGGYRRGYGGFGPGAALGLFAGAAALAAGGGYYGGYGGGYPYGGYGYGYGYRPAYYGYGGGYYRRPFYGYRRAYWRGPYGYHRRHYWGGPRYRYY